MRILYRSSVVWNLILFCFCSYIFLYLQNIYLLGETLTQKETALNFFRAHIPYVSFVVITVILVYNLKRSAKYFVSLLTIWTLIYSTINLFEEFSKFIVILLFFYLLCSYYLLQFFNMEKKESYYNSLYSDNLLFEPMLQKIKVQIKFQDENVSGYLTNWSDEGGYVYLEQNSDKNIRRGELTLSYLENEFKNPIYVVSRKKNGFGFKVGKKSQSATDLGWNEFYEIIEEMGLKPELVI